MCGPQRDYAIVDMQAHLLIDPVLLLLDLRKLRFSGGVACQSPFEALLFRILRPRHPLSRACKYVAT